jgi:hypothetical protein
MILGILLSAVALAGATQDSGGPAGDPVTGVWKGLATGDGSVIPEWGYPASLLIQRKGDHFEGRLLVQGFDLQVLAGRFDPDASVLEFNARFLDAPLTGKLSISDDRLTGAISGTALSMDLEAMRISRKVMAAPPAPSAPTDISSLDGSAWAEDLDFLAGYLPQVHADAYHSITPAEWRSTLDDIRTSLPALDGLETSIAMARLVARVGDAHTGLNWRELPGFASAPIRFQLFSDGLFVTAVDERWGDALGRRVIRIGANPIAEALSSVAKMFAAENEAWRRVQAPGHLRIPKLLATLGLIESDEQLPVTVELEPGEEATFVIELAGEGSLVTAPDPEFDPVARWQERRGMRYWLEVIDEESIVYFAYNSCAEDPARPMSGFIGEVLEAVDLIDAEHLVIDLRNNSGGNSNVLSQHIGRLAKHPRLREPGRLCVLIGPVTYSSGMMNAHQLRQQANATLVGEPTGGRPNSYGEVLSFRLPNSGMAVSYSTKYFRMLPDSDPPSVEPDVLVELSSEDYFTGFDPVLGGVSDL